MTVPTYRSREDYTGNGVTTSYPYQFRIYEATDLVVTRATPEGVETELVLNTDYTVTGVGKYAGGNVELTTSLPTGYRLAIERVLPVTQETDLRNQGAYFAETHEDVFDRLVMLLQRFSGYLGIGPDGAVRTLLLGKTDIDGQGAFRARQNRIQDLADPVADQDAANKRWSLGALRTYQLSNDSIITGSTLVEVPQWADVPGAVGGGNVSATMNVQAQALLDRTGFIFVLASTAQDAADEAQLTANAAKDMASAALPKSGGEATGDITVPSLNSGQLAGHRNRIINGKMEIAQRGASSSVLGSYLVDRWFTQTSGTSAVASVAQQADGPNAEFPYSLRVTCTTADTSVDAADIAGVQQRIEGYNISDLKGRTFTLSFWVRSSKTGTHAVAMRNHLNDRALISHYTVNAANTWEYKKITVVGGIPSDGGWDFTTGRGLVVSWPLICGANNQAPAEGSWQTGNYQSTATAAANNLLDTVGNIFAITGVQLEPSSVATPFEHRNYIDELLFCQRYYYKALPVANVNLRVLGMGFCRTTTVASIVLPIPLHMRGVNEITQTGVASNYSVGIAASTVTCSAVPTLRYSGPGCVELQFTVASGLTAGQGCTGLASSNIAAHIGVDGEL